MDTPLTKPIRSHRTKLGERAIYSIRVTPEERRQMQAIAAYRHWPESEAWREAMRFYLSEQKELLRLIAAKNDHADAAD